MYHVSEYTFDNVLRMSTEQYTTRRALCSVSGSCLTYADVRRKVGAISSFLAANGVKKGDRVVLLSENRPEWGCVYLAVTAMGAVIVPILTDFLPDQIANILSHADPVFAFVSERTKEKLVQYKGDIPVVSVETMLPARGRVGTPFDAGRDFDYPKNGEDDLASIIYTSGTTGHSKGVMLTHRNIVYNAWACRFKVRFHRYDRLLSVLPLAHSYECTCGFVYPFMHGSSVYYLEKPPAPSVLLPALAAVHPTIMLSVPLLIEKIVRANVMPKLKGMKALAWPVIGPVLYRAVGKKLIKALGGRIRWFGIGGAPLSKDVEALLLKAKFPFSVGYGLTETSPLISGNPPRQTIAGSCGFPIPGLEVRIAEPLQHGGEGEIQVRGPTVMRGYYKEEAKTKECFTEDGWLKTGDLGTFTPDGRLAIRGRLKTMILGPSGENIYPEEIETVLNTMAEVQESLVYSDTDGAIVALVQIKPEFLENLRGGLQDKVDEVGETLGNVGGAVSAYLERLKKDVNSKVAAFSRVHRVEHHEEPFEKTPSLKIKRYLYPRKKGDADDAKKGD